MGEITEADLPELQLLPLVNPIERNSTITAALRDLPHLRKVRPCHVARRYGIDSSTAVNCIDRAFGRYVPRGQRKVACRTV